MVESIASTRLSRVESSATGTTQILVILHAKQHMPLNFNQLKNSLVFPMSIGTETECPS
jgi:hypothetical protein